MYGGGPPLPWPHTASPMHTITPAAIAPTIHLFGLREAPRCSAATRENPWSSDEPGLLAEALDRLQRCGIEYRVAGLDHLSGQNHAVASDREFNNDVGVRR